jgi:hypothetical protein
MAVFCFFVMDSPTSRSQANRFEYSMWQMQIS